MKIINKILSFFRSIFGYKKVDEDVSKKNFTVKPNDSKFKQPKKVSPQEARYNWLCKHGLTPRETKRYKIMFTSKPIVKVPSVAQEKFLRSGKKKLDKKYNPPSHYYGMLWSFKKKVYDLREIGEFKLGLNFVGRNKQSIPIFDANKS